MNISMNFYGKIAALFFFAAVGACSKPDSGISKEQNRIWVLPMSEVAALADSGDDFAKLRIAVEDANFDREKSARALSEIYKKSKSPAAGFYLAAVSSGKKRSALLNEISRAGNSVYSRMADGELAMDELAMAYESGDGEKFNKAYDKAFSLAKLGLQSCAARLLMFIETKNGALKMFRDTDGDIMFLSEKLSRITKNNPEDFILIFARESAKRGEWRSVAKILKPLADEFLGRKNFTMEESLSAMASGKTFSQAKAAAILAYMSDAGLGVAENSAYADRLRKKIVESKNFSICKELVFAFEKSIGRKNSFIAASSKDADFYRNCAMKFESGQTERLKKYNSEIESRMSDLSKKPLVELEKENDEIGKVEYAKKLLGLKIRNVNATFTFGIFNDSDDARAVKMLESLSDKENGFAQLELAKLYYGGNLKSDFCSVMNMPVDYDYERAFRYAARAATGKNVYAAARAKSLLASMLLMKNHSTVDFFPHHFCDIDTTRADDAVALLHSSGELGNPKAYAMLSYLYAGVPISFREYLIEPNKKAAFAFRKRAADLGDLAYKSLIAESLYFGIGVDKNAKEAKRYILELLRDEAGEKNSPVQYTVFEIAANLCEKNELEGYSPKDAMSIREKIPQSCAYQISAMYDSGMLDNPKARDYWRGVQNKKREPQTFDASFVNYFKARPQTAENLLLLGLSYYPQFFSDKAIGKKAYQALSRSSDMGNLDAVKVLSCDWFPWLNPIDKKANMEKAMKAGLPISDWQYDEYNLRRFKETKNAAFLRAISNNKISFEDLKFLEKHSKDDKFLFDCVCAKLFESGTSQDISEAVEMLKCKTKGSIGCFQANVLLSFIYSDMSKMLNNPRLSTHYAKEAQRAKSSFDVPFYPHYAETKPSLKSYKLYSALFDMVDSDLENYYVRYGEGNSYEDLKKIFERNPHNIPLKLAFAEKAREFGKFDEAAKLYLELQKAEPENWNIYMPIAELYWFGRGVKQDKKLASEIYGKFFHDIKKNNLPYITDGILSNSLSKWRSHLNSAKVEIPKELVLENLKMLNIAALGRNSNAIMDYLRRNGEIRLAAEIEKKLIEIKDANSMASYARKLLSKRSPENDKRAFELFSEICAYEKSGFCLNELAIMHFYGIGTKRDYKKAFEIFEKQISGNASYGGINATACIWLALMYKEGLGVEASEEKAKRYIDMAASREMVENNFWHYGVSLIYGDGVNHYRFPKNRELGIELIKISATGKNPDFSGMQEYASMLERGSDVKRDLKKAAQLFEDAARKRFSTQTEEEDALFHFSDAVRIYKTADGVKDFGKAFALVSEWLERRPDSPNANCEAALLYMNGIGVPKDEKKAMEYLQKAIACKSEYLKSAYLWRAYGLLAYCYMEGIGVEKDSAKVEEIAGKIRTLKTSRCGVWHPYLTLAAWFNPNTKICDNNVVENPALTPDEAKTLFWLGKFEKLAATARNPRFRIEAYKKLIDFYSKEPRFKNGEKAEALKKLFEAEKIKSKAKKK